MEDIPDADLRACDGSRVLIGRGATSKKPTLEVAVPVAAIPGRCEIHDCGYKRHGVSNLFVFQAPQENWWRVSVTDRRTCLDRAEQVRQLVDVEDPDQHMTLVMDNLNTHGLSSLTKAFPPEEAHRIKSRVDIVTTPKHGSWLNMAEINVLSRQSPNRRIPDRATLRAKVAAWQERRNAASVKVN